MLDYAITGATVVDGTGRAPTSASIGVRGGRIVSVGHLDEPARSTVDADGLVVAPGFVDPHTHYDAQLFWDPFATPSSIHGVTTVIGGNCGFTLAPLHAEDADYTRKMMAKVEGMPLSALENGVSWGWESFADYLSALEGRIAVNAAFLVGHCALRRYVMGPRSANQEAGPGQLERMTAVLHEALDVGGLGFSTTRSSTHSDGDGFPVSSRYASREELLALCRAAGEHEGTTLEAIVQGCLDMFSDDEIELLSEMSAAACRPLNWNVLTVDSRVPERVSRQLEASTRAAERGGRVVALTMPVLVPMNMSFLNYCALNMLPGWGEILGLRLPERMAKLADPEARREMMRRADSDEAGVFRRLADFRHYVIGDTYSPENEGMSGQVVGEIAKVRGEDPFDVLVEIVLKDELRTILWPMPPDNDDATWRLRREVWADNRAMLGGSDAGAHLDRMCGAPYPTRFLGDMIRGRRLVPIERAVQMLTDVPARLFGLRERGQVTEGFYADLVVFDPDRIASAPARLVTDLPGDSSRLTAASEGIVSVLVNGVETVREGELVGSTPGRLLRSGRDTYTVATR
jgi:N-acyl-D-aspartate/D-glutamate deacylase